MTRWCSWRRRCGARLPRTAVVPLILTRPNRSPQARELGEALLSALRKGGYRGAAQRAAFRAVSAFVAGFALAELHGPFADDASDRAAELRRGLRALLHR